MIKYTALIAVLLALTSALRAADVEPQAQGNATITVGDDTATWPVWNCRKVILAHQLPNDDILVDQHVKLIDYDDVIQMVLILNGRHYLADIPARFDVFDVDYEGPATEISPTNGANIGTSQFRLRVLCNP